jgi:AraC-like DNA-binding protein
MAQELQFKMDYCWFLRTKDLNLDSRIILSKAGLSVSLYDKVNAKITVDEFYKIFEALQSLFPDKTYALEIEKVMSVESFSLPYTAALHSCNLKEYFKRIQRFEKIAGPVHIITTENDAEFAVEMDFLPSVIEVPSLFIEFVIVSFIKLVRLGARKEIKPLSVITTKELDAKAYYNYLGVYPQKGSINKIVFTKEDAGRQFFTYDENMWRIHEQALQNALDQVDKNISCSYLVQSALLRLLPSGKCSIETIAEKLNISKRTLQRNLKTEDTNYSKQLNRVREKQSKYYLEKTDLTCEEISFRLGYDHPNSFSRAFVKWTGMNPENFRNKNQNPVAKNKYT